MSFDWCKLLEDSLQHKYILVVGHEVMLDSSICGGDSHRYLMLKYSEAVADNAELDRREFMTEYKIPIEMFNNRLRELLSLKLFRVVVTTTVDDLIERVMREVYGSKLRVINFYDEDNDLKFTSGRNEFYETEPTLYYAFGKAISASTFANNEDDKLKIVADWLNHSRDGFPCRFYNYLQTKKLLALGCKQDDWLFRFFWYSLRRNVRILSNGITNQSYVEKRHTGTVAIEYDENNPSDRSLIRFIKRNGSLYDNNAERFISEFVNKMITNDENGDIMELIKNSATGGCFISYASEDFNMAFNLYLRLQNKGFTVWIDNKKLKPGADYEQRIKNAIEQCSIFLPILSNTTLQDFSKGEFYKDYSEKRYYLREWEMATNMNKNIIPILIEEFEVKSQAYSCTPWKSKNEDKTVFVQKTDSINKLIGGLRELSNEE